MYLTPQGQNPQRQIDELKVRIDALEKAINELQSIKIPKRGRPPKDAYGQPETKKPD